MKSLKQLEDEYFLHEVEIEDELFDAMDIQVFIKGKLSELNEEKIDILKAIKSNLQNKRIAKYFCFIKRKYRIL